MPLSVSQPTRTVSFFRAVVAAMRAFPVRPDAPWRPAAAFVGRSFRPRSLLSGPSLLSGHPPPPPTVAFALTTRSCSATPSSCSEQAYHKTYALNGTGRASKVTVHTLNTNHTIHTDVPRSMGGTDTAPQPVELLLASWIGCTQATALFVGRHMPSQRLLVDRIQFVNIHAVRDERKALSLPLLNARHADGLPPSRLQRITGTIRVYAKRKQTISTRDMNILRQQTELRCPIANMILASGCTIDVQWIDGNAHPDKAQNRDQT